MKTYLKYLEMSPPVIGPTTIPTPYEIPSLPSAVALSLDLQISVTIICPARCGGYKNSHKVHTNSTSSTRD